MIDTAQATLIFTNGQWQVPLSVMPDNKNFTIMPLNQAWQQHKALLSNHVNDINHTDQGLFIHINKNTQATQTLYLTFQQQNANETMTRYRNIIVADSGSQANIVLHYTSDTNTNNITTNNQIILQHDAGLTWHHIQQLGEETNHTNHMNIAQQKNSTFHYHQFDFGGHHIYHDIRCQLLDKYARCELNGLYVLNGKQYVDNNSLIEHQQPNGYSREYFKGILDDHSRGIFRGKTYVHPHAIHTDAKQYNRNLLLSPRAEADSSPALEIYADDVQCAHGATVSQLDENELFYLRSRGISQAKAASLLCYGFAHELIERVKLADVSQLLENLLSNKRGQYD